MKILYIHQYFKKPSEGGAIRSFHLAKSLIQAGHEVVVITGYSGKKSIKENFEGIEIHYLPVFYENKLSSTNRLFAFLKFLLLTCRKALEIKDVDFCYATSTPLTVGIIALIIKKLKKVPYIFEVRDLWPEIPVDMGYIKNPLLIKLLYLLEKKIYSNSEKLVALSPGIQEGIKKRLGRIEKEIHLIPNFSDLEFFSPKVLKDDIQNKEQPFTIVYAGAFGKANYISSLSEAIKLSAEKFGNQVMFLLAGEGAEKENLLKNLKKMGYGNYRDFGFLNKTEIRDLLMTSDASFISFSPYSSLENVSPNKFFDALAAGHICIVNFKGWIKELVESNEIGFYFDPNKPSLFTEALQEWIGKHEKIREAKKNSRRIAQREFSLELMQKRFLELFN